MAFFGLIFGAVLGAFTAWRRKGNTMDMLQYAFGCGIAFALLFFVVGLIWLRVG